LLYLGLVGFMHEYQIRVLSSGHPIVIDDAMHPDDHAAMKSARTLAGDRPFEVWRGLDCIYAPPKTRLTPTRRSFVARAWRP
jgi:hypothetical protein